MIVKALIESAKDMLDKLLDISFFRMEDMREEEMKERDII